MIFTSCGTTVQREDVVGCWRVAYIDTDGIKIKDGNYKMCFEENGELVSQRNNGAEKITAEWNIEESDSTIVIHYEGRGMPDTMKVVKVEEEEMHLRVKKLHSYITLYLRKEK